MNDLGNLLQMIYDLLSGWYNSFTSHALAVMDKLNLIETDTSSIKNSASDIKSNTDDIKDNTGAIITPVQSIKTNTDSIKNDTTSIKNNVSTMSNQLGTISTNVGTASAYAEDVANNTLDIKDRVVTIGSDTTQLRSNSNTITSDVSDIKTALNYYLANTPVTEDVEGAICNIDTDLSDYLQACKVTIPADLTGFNGITFTKNGKNFINVADTTVTLNNAYYASVTLGFAPKAGTTYTLSFEVDTTVTPFSISVGCGVSAYSFDITSKANQNNGRVFISFTPTLEQLTNRPNIFLRAPRYPSSQTISATLKNFMLEIGSSVTAYEPYKAMTYPVSFGSTITDGAEIDLLEGVIKVNSTPVSYQSITPIAVRTYKGVNNIYSDGGTTALTYRETLKHYIDKQEA